MFSRGGAASVTPSLFYKFIRRDKADTVTADSVDQFGAFVCWIKL